MRRDMRFTLRTTRVAIRMTSGGSPAETRRRRAPHADDVERPTQIVAQRGEEEIAVLLGALERSECTLKSSP